MSPHEIRGGLDTSVVLRLLTGDPPEQTKAALTHLAETEAAGMRLVVSNVVVMECYFACQHHYGTSKKDTLKALLKLLSMPTFLTDPNLEGILKTKQLASKNPGFVDRMIHAEYTSLGVPLITFEKSARRLPETEVLS